MSKHYKINLPWFLFPFLIWVAWLAVWIWVPERELIWAPIKWIMIALFAPVGIILLGALAGYRIEILDKSLRFGYFPFIRTIRYSDIQTVRKGAVYPLSIWQTKEFFTVVTVKGEEVSAPCDDAEEIIRSIRQFLPACNNGGTDPGS